MEYRRPQRNLQRIPPWRDEKHPNATGNVAVGVAALVGKTDAAHPFLGKTLKVTVTDNTITVAPLAGNVNQSLNVIQIVAA